MNGTVFVIDDDASARQSMRALLTTLRFSCREFDSAESFLENYDAATPGCVLCDLRLQGMSGLELLDILDRNAATTPVILVTAYAKTPLTVRAMRRGAVNVLDKPIDEDQLWEAVREALNLDTKRREKRQQQQDLQMRFEQLTRQENQVLDMLLRGMTNREIASKLDVSTRTVEARRHNIFRKTQTESVPDLVKLTLAFQQTQPQDLAYV